MIFIDTNIRCGLQCNLYRVQSDCTPYDWEAHGARPN